MNFKTPFAEVHIRLREDLSGFVCTVRSGWLHASTHEFAVELHPMPLSRPIEDYSIPDPEPCQYAQRVRNSGRNPRT